MKQIATKIILLGIGISAIFSLLLGAAMYLSNEKSNADSLALLSRTLHEDFDRLIQGQVENALSVLQASYEANQGAGLSEADNQKRCADLLRAIRYNKDGYFWADTSEGVNVVLPGKPEVEGTNRFDSKDANGTEFMKEIIGNGLKEGGGFTDYYFPRTGETEPKAKRSYSLAFKPFGWVVGTGNYIDDIQAVVAAKKADLDRTVVILRLVVFGLIAFAFALTAFLALALGRRISRPLRAVSTALHDIASGEGDLTRVLAVDTRDETGQIAGSFNLFTDKLNAIISSVRGVADDLSEIGGELAVNLHESASGLNEITSNIDSMRQRIQSQAAGVTETTATMQEISHTIESLNQSIEQQAASLSHSSAAIEQMVGNIAAVAANVDKISERFTGLLRAAETGKNKLNSVNEVIQAVEAQSRTLGEANAVIASIAAQTNLLAMNAAIEAAHAGDAGKGFSVVADEIRKLAENSSAQSQSVAANIKGILDSIGQAVVASQDAERSFDETQALIREVDELESTVKSSMVEQNEGSRQILGALGEINGITGVVRNGSAAMATGSREILVELERLNQITEEIRTGMGELAAGAIEINKAVNGINDLSVRNKQNIDTLGRETARFKIRAAT